MAAGAENIHDSKDDGIESIGSHGIDQDTGIFVGFIMRDHPDHDQHQIHQHQKNAGQPDPAELRREIRAQCIPSKVACQ